MSNDAATATASTTNYNKWVVFGNLADDLRVNPDHPNIATIRLATTFGIDQLGQPKTAFFDLAFNGEDRIRGNQALLTRGRFVRVEAVVGQDSWVAADGSKRVRPTFSVTNLSYPKA